MKKIDGEVEILSELKEKLEGEFVEQDMDFLTQEVAAELQKTQEPPTRESS